MSVGAARVREWRERVMRGVLVGSSDVPFTLVTAGWVGCTHNASRRNTATAKRRGDIGLPAIFARKFAADSITRPSRLPEVLRTPGSSRTFSTSAGYATVTHACGAVARRDKCRVSAATRTQVCARRIAE